MSIFIIILFCLTAVLWIWAFLDILGSGTQNATDRILWLLIIFLFPILGSIIYFQFGKKRFPKKLR